MAQQWAQNVQAAFHGDPVLAKRIVDAGYRYQNELPSVFDDIAQHILSAQSTTTLPTNTKKRKIDDGSQANGTTAATALSNAAITFECKNVSFQAPARKKLKLDLARDGQDPRRQEIRLIDQKTEQREHTLSTEQIDQIFCLPLPEKQQRQWNFCVLPQAGATTSEGLPCEQLVFTLNETKPDDAHSATRPAAEGDTYVTVAEHELNQLLQPLGKRVVKPDEAEFASSIPQSHRKGEKAYHVKAHRGTKEGIVCHCQLVIYDAHHLPQATSSSCPTALSSASRSLCPSSPFLPLSPLATHPSCSVRSILSLPQQRTLART